MITHHLRTCWKWNLSRFRCFPQQTVVMVAVCTARHIVGATAWRFGSQLTLTLKSSTPSPISSTSPEHSKPKMNGVFGGESMAPWRTIRSWKLSPLQPETDFVCHLSNWYHNYYKVTAVPQQQQQIYTGKTQGCW